MKRMLFAALTACFVSFPVFSQNDIEDRARDLASQIRCLVCQGQSIKDSDTDFARDLNVLVRDKIRDGWTDDAIFAFLQDRYGEFILFKPPFAWATLPLWLSPILALLAGSVIIYRYRRRKK